MRDFSVELFGDALRLRRDDGTVIDTTDLDRAALESLLSAVADTYRDQRIRRIDALGERLTAFVDGRGRWLDALLGEPSGAALGISVDERLRHLPWELLHRQGAFLCADAARPVCPVRRAGERRREAPVENRPLRVLFEACAPSDQPALDHEREEYAVLRRTRESGIELVVEELGTLEGLRRRVDAFPQGHFDVLHLTGHADVVQGRAIFLFETDLGESQEVEPDALVEAIGGRVPRLVFLSGCSTGRAPRAGALPSFCEAIVAAGAPAVLGWGLPVLDDTGIAAAEALYERLAAGDGLDLAVVKVRAALRRAGHADWHLLRLYADRTPLGPMITPAGTKGRARVRQGRVDRIFEDAMPEAIRHQKVSDDLAFVGRRRETQRCLRVLRSQPGDEHHAEGVLIQGLGGLGKTSLAARLLRRLPEHQRFVVFGRVDEAQLVHVLSRSVDEPELATRLQDGRVPLQRRLAGFLAERSAIVVLDDFEQNVERDGSGPRVDAQGLAVVRVDAGQALVALLEAIRETESASRVVVTSRYLLSPLATRARLHVESLEELRGAELLKKVEQLEIRHELPGALAGAGIAAREWPALRERVVERAGGNPRMLEWLFAAVAEPGTGHEAILARLEGKAAEFREQVALEALIELMGADGRRTLARLGVLRLPVDIETVAVACDGVDGWRGHLDRAVALGLVERGRDAADEGHRYALADVVRPLLPSLDGAEVDGPEVDGPATAQKPWAEPQP